MFFAWLNVKIYVPDFTLPLIAVFFNLFCITDHFMQ